MKKFLLLLLPWLAASLSQAQVNPAIKSYVAFLQGVKTPAKEYIFELFKTHDLVVICERPHMEFTQYDFISDIIKDKRFAADVGNIFTEVGTRTVTPELNRFFSAKNLSEEEQQRTIVQIRRNLSWGIYWDANSYTYLLQTIYALNNKLPPGYAVNLYPADVPLNWDLVTDTAMYRQTLLPLLRKRDSVIAAYIIEQFNTIKATTASRKKALVIMNYRHAFNNDFYIPSGQKISNVTQFLFQKFGNRVANVFLNTPASNMKDESRWQLVQDGKWDAAFQAEGNIPIGFDFRNSPFGRDSFDYWFPGPLTYQDVFTGMVFYNPVEKQKWVMGVPGLLDKNYADEFFRRYQLSQSIGIFNARKLSPEDIIQIKAHPEEMERDVNTIREMPFPQTGELVKQREKWLH